MSTLVKVIMGALLSALTVFGGMWLTFASSTVSRGEAQQMIDTTIQQPMQRIEAKQDRAQDSIDDLRERLARIEERMNAQERRDRRQEGRQ